MMEETRMTIEQMRQKASEARKAAKALQQQLKTVTNPDERKLLARQMNDLFTEASSLSNEAKNRRALEKSIEQEFLSIKANLEDD